MLLWLSAFAAVASYNSSGKCGNGCGKSKATVAMGVFIWYVMFADFYVGVLKLTVFVCLQAPIHSHDHHVRLGHILLQPGRIPAWYEPRSHKRPNDRSR